MPVTAPSTSNIGALLRARTVANAAGGGRELGDFTSATRPTGAEVTDLIARATRVVGNVLGPKLDTADADTKAAATDLAALRAAMLIEQSYFPDQVASGESPYEQLRAMYDEDLAALRDNLSEDQPGRARFGSIRATTDVVASDLTGGLPPDWV